MSNDLKIIAVASTAALKDVFDALGEAGYAPQAVADSAAVSAELGLRPALVVADAAIVSELGDRDQSTPVLAICEPNIDALLQARRDGATDALPWPIGRGELAQRVGDLVNQTTQRRDAILRRDSAETLTELALGLDDSFEFEEALSDALQRLEERCEASRVLVIAWHQDRELPHLMGASDDASAAKLPLPADLCGELDALKVKKSEIIAENIDVTDRVLAYSSAPLEAERTLFLVPLLCDGAVFGAVEMHLGATEISGPVRELARQFAALLAPRLHSSELYRSLKEQTQRVSVDQVDARTSVLAKYEEYFQRAYDGIVVVGGQEQVLYLNPAGEQITGFSNSGLVESAFETFVAPSDRPAVYQRLKEIRQGHALGQSFDIGLVTTSGDPILVSFSVSAVLDDGGVLVLSFRDVTEARALSEELRATKEFLERLIDSTVDGIIATDNAGRVVLFNQGAERIFGISAEEVVGRMTIDDLYADGVAARVMEQLRGTADGGIGRLHMTRKEILNQQKELVPVSLSASIIYEQDQEVGTVGIIGDLRDRLRIERRLLQAQEKLIETEKQALIAELAGTTAHELNQPLTSVMGYAELLAKRIGEEDSNQKAVATILKEAQRMADIVRKIGKITRYETKTYVGGTQILDLDKSSEAD